MIKVYDMDNMDNVYYYDCNEKQAVISTYLINNNMASLLATKNYNENELPILENDRIISCGNFTTIKNRKGMI